MSSRPAVRLLRSVLAAALVTGVVVAVPAAASAPTAEAAPLPSSQDVRAELDKAVQALQAAEGVEGQIDNDAARLTESLEKTQVELAGFQEQLTARARLAYTSGVSDDVLVTMITSDDPAATISRLGLLGAVSRRSTAALEQATVAQHRIAEQQAQLEVLAERAQQNTAVLQARNAELATLLAKAQAAEEAARKAAEEKARREAAARAAAAAEATRAAEAKLAAARSAAAKAKAAAAVKAARAAAPRAARAAVPSGGSSGTVRGSFACPVGSNHSFTDTYGAPRSGGRRHEGVDIFAPYGSPAYAVESGVIVKAYSNRLGGLAILLRGNSGDEYYYAHQERNIVSSGQRVTAGQQIGTVGTSGNARGTAPHVHFERWPGGGNPVNPTGFVRNAC